MSPIRHGSTWKALCIFGIGFLFVFITQCTKSAELRTWMEASSSSQSRKQNDRGLFQLFRSDPKTTEVKIPRLVHFTLPDDPPAHYVKVIEFTIQKLESYNFNYMIHHDEDINVLIRMYYPSLVPTWEILMKYHKKDRGARVGDFGRLVVLYHFGGIYLDGDMIPCADLTELINEPGVATFPQVNAYRKQILNSAISGPRGHKVFWVALERARDNENFVNEHILNATGPAHLAASVMEYHKLTKTRPIMDFYKHEPVPEPADGGLWVQSGGIRFGAYLKDGSEMTRGVSTRERLGLSHLHFRSWVSSSKFKKTPCEQNLDLMDPFLNYICRDERGRDTHWSQCGDGSQHSGMLNV